MPTNNLIFGDNLSDVILEKNVTKHLIHSPLFGVDLAVGEL